MTEDGKRANPKPPPVDGLSYLWRRINEHKVVQWSAAYLAVAYALQHGVTLTSDAFEWPHAVTRISMLLFILGLPLVMTFAWYHGARANRHFSKAELSIISILLVASSLLFYVLVRPSSEAPAGAPAVQEAGVAAAKRAAADPHAAIAVAVLPFANLSDDKAQEFFSDGMTDELGTALAKIPDLRVVARQSAYRFKGANEDARAIGQALNATHLIEGSVRKAGNRVRISAELVKADDGLRVWADNYDRDLTDVFAIQEDIARAIAVSLRMSLGLKPGENLVNSRKIDADSYDKYLRAKALRQGRGGLQDETQAASLLESVVAKNPDYAPAWAALSEEDFAIAQAHANNFKESIAESRPLAMRFREKAEADANHALQLDPNLAPAHADLGALAWTRGALLEADEHFARALALDPGDANEVLIPYGIRLGVAGRLKEALATFEKAHTIEPFAPQILLFTVQDRWLNGQNDEALALAATMRPINRAPVSAMIYASLGRHGDAAAALTEIAGDRIPSPRRPRDYCERRRRKADPPKNFRACRRIWNSSIFTPAHRNAPSTHSSAISKSAFWPAVLLHSSGIRPTRHYARRSGS
jgi:TolB-like protein